MTTQSKDISGPNGQVSGYNSLSNYKRAILPNGGSISIEVPNKEIKEIIYGLLVGAGCFFDELSREFREFPSNNKPTLCSLTTGSKINQSSSESGVCIVLPAGNKVWIQWVVPVSGKVSLSTVSDKIKKAVTRKGGLSDRLKKEYDSHGEKIYEGQFKAVNPHISWVSCCTKKLSSKLKFSC